jgi:hypothetical protein
MMKMTAHHFNVVSLRNHKSRTLLVIVSKRWRDWCVPSKRRRVG